MYHIRSISLFIFHPIICYPSRRINESRSAVRGSCSHSHCTFFSYNYQLMNLGNGVCIVHTGGTVQVWDQRLWGENTYTLLCVAATCHRITKRSSVTELESCVYSTFRSICRKGIMIGLKALAEDIYHADKLHQWAEMRREVAHQTNLLELSLGGHSPLNELLSQRQLSVCITCGFKGGCRA